MTNAEAKYLTVQQVADELGLNPGRIMNAIRLKKLRAVKTEFAIQPEDLEAFRIEYVRINEYGETFVRHKRTKPKSKAELRIEAARQAREQARASANVKAGRK